MPEGEARRELLDEGGDEVMREMGISTAAHLVERILREGVALCVECNREPDAVWVEMHPGERLGDPELRAFAMCCHSKKKRRIEGPMTGVKIASDFRVIKLDYLRGNLADIDWRQELRFFRRNWAECKRPTVREMLEGRTR